jgi:hypothetical protein
MLQRQQAGILALASKRPRGKNTSTNASSAAKWSICANWMTFSFTRPMHTGRTSNMAARNG